MDNNTPTPLQPSQKRRIGYIDALRGFTMILVVCAHTMLYSNIEKISYSSFFGLYRMPLFFFISGFIFYKKETLWRCSNSLNFVFKKFLVQIIPTAIFLAIYRFAFSLGELGGMYNGYWFTIALFEFFIIYVLCMNIIRNNLIFYTLILLFSITAYVLSFSSQLFEAIPTFHSFLIYPFGFFIFFILGTIAKKHFNKILFIFNHNIIMMAIIALMMIGSICFINGCFVHLEVRLLLSILGIFSIFYFFMKNGEYFDNSRIGKALQFIGRRTLDIYLLHYFFVNNSMSWIKNIGVESPTLTFVISILTALVIIGICLLISKFLRTNPLLGKILFGAKVSTNEKG